MLEIVTEILFTATVDRLDNFCHMVHNVVDRKYKNDVLAYTSFLSIDNFRHVNT